jgi:hypothetical protein
MAKFCSFFNGWWRNMTTLWLQSFVLICLKQHMWKWKRWRKGYMHEISSAWFNHSFKKWSYCCEPSILWKLPTVERWCGLHILTFCRIYSSFNPLSREMPSSEVKVQCQLFEVPFFSFLGWGETESTWYISHYWAYCTSSRWYMMMSVEHSMEWVAKETEVLRENLPQYRFVLHKSHMAWPGPKPRPHRWEASD